MKWIISCVFCFFMAGLQAQKTPYIINALKLEEVERERVYKLKASVDIPVIAVGAGWSGYAFTKVYSKENTPLATIQGLNRNDINGFDRWGATRYSQKAASVSNIFFFGAMPLPFALLADKKIRSDAGTVGVLYLQAMSVTGFLYTGSLSLFDRYRPLAYNPNVPIEERTEGGTRNSFFAGHVALVGTSTFFVAKVLSDYHPNSRLKPVFFTAAALATGATGYLRHRAGKHFPSDIIVGTTVGTLSGILVPHLHKIKAMRNTNLTIMPYSGGNSSGLYLSYKL